MGGLFVPIAQYFCKVTSFKGEKQKKSIINFTVWDKMSNFASQKSMPVKKTAWMMQK
jgi:hypothetical protein